MTAVAAAPHTSHHAPGAEAGMLWRQTRHELVTLVRTPITLILSIGLPLLFFVLLSALIGNQVLDETNGVRLVQYLAPGMASFGVVMATFSFLAVGLAEARATGVVKRQAGSPAPRWVLIGGRMGAALVLGLTSTALVITAGVLFYDLIVPSRSVAAIVVTLVVASACFSALGLALAMALPTMQLTLAVSNGVVIPLAFISDMFMVGGQMPPWLATIGWLFPLKHLTALFADALNPYLTGSGFELDHLAVIVLWGLAGAIVATALLRRDRDRDTSLGSGAGADAHTRARSADAVPRRTAAPSLGALLLDQVRHAQSILWRDASAVFFAVAFPVVLVAIIPAVNGGGDQIMSNGLSLGTFYAATMAVYGAAVTAYVNMPQGVAEDRERGVLKRTGGTPLPANALIVGRVAGALGVSLVTGLAIAVLAGLAYRPGWPSGMPAAVVTLVIATVCFAVVGLAVMTFVRSAQAVVGVTLGTLLPLAFISDIFVVGASFPPVVEAISWLFPLRHAARAMTESIAPASSGLAWGHLAVLLAWTLAGAVVLVLRYRPEARESGHTAGRRNLPQTARTSSR
ncbi:ABC-type multidrug transport system permease subunit [Humibacillus xanthopallidus]|uniref:Transport permease protein n=1 Tax=Humibacillus xanthopallidus TaxID=412689 RepID=A0A543PPI7_9MICO|nr:ABC transporter permease [Humibacillus xanthopallidus]TQN45985.1 ABC-type multidrug transport system permease subunit [Humibacillus xanthopallidus]